MLPKAILQNRQDESGHLESWDTKLAHEALCSEGREHSLRSTERLLESSGIFPGALELEEIRDEFERAPLSQLVVHFDERARRKRQLSLILQLHETKGGFLLFANDGRKGRKWLFLDSVTDSTEWQQALAVLANGRNLIVWPHGAATTSLRKLVQLNGGHDILLEGGNTIRIGCFAYRAVAEPISRPAPVERSSKIKALSHLDRLEAESIHIMREVVAQSENPVMLYSVGKDSAVMLHLAQKAFHPGRLPFPLLHVDTRWKFQEMYQFRAAVAEAFDIDLLVHINPEGIEKNINPYDHGSSLHTDVMKTQGLKQALDQHKFDAAFGGARRDEEKSRAKERVFSFRTATHRWDPKNQRPELWNLYNGYKSQSESIRAFPLSNWTELDIWEYIYREKVPIVPLYFAAERPVVERDGMLILVDDERMKLAEGEQVLLKKVRFRTLGCYPLSGAVESEADDLSSIVMELLQSKTSERQARAIDNDSTGSMERKKQEGYF
jgi:sulfate adenylyltransferase subunit 2